ncbi:endonuclease/exonuclease/phosphatase family protein [Nocardioides campestrisoli]|uniref:endonuclease/exonuclease/phosphatase family protein n=1 Tax=Nocardioides campestrisoli TaxID=2736757 RepID=UPI00163D6547|nr:endonuclease/exonuclease/phosphatase family protein [Nocardioides campestrisoli]
MLRIATANAASGRSPSPASGHAKDPGDWALDDWAHDAAALDLDLLAVQEVDHLLPRSGHADQTATVAHALAAGGDPWHARFAAAVHGTPGNAATMRPAPATVGEEPSYGVALLSRHPVEQWDEHRMAPSAVRIPVRNPSWTDEERVVVADEQRVALAARVLAPGGPVTVVTTHLSFVPWRAGAQLRGLVAWARALPRPLVLLGDLNLPASVASRLTGWTRVPTGPTYPAQRPVARLDHVLLDGCTAEEAGTVRLAGADHLAVRATVRW